MAVFQASIVRNRLLASLAPDEFAALEPKLKRVPLTVQEMLIKAHQPIQNIFFPESGVVSSIANTDEGSIEIGLIGREGFIGVPVILGTNQTPHTSMVQGAGEALRISTQDLRATIQARPAIFDLWGSTRRR